MATITNVATLSYRGTLISSNVTSGQLVTALEVSKTALNPNYRTGDEVVYIITLRNTSTNPITGVTITDDLGGYTLGGTTVYPLTARTDDIRLFANGEPVGNPTVTAAQPLVVGGITVPANGNATLIYGTTANGIAPAAVGGEIVNTATVTAPGLADAITASETLAVQTEPILGITKAMTPTTVSTGDEVTYNFTLQNIGNTEATATDAISITDTFTPPLSNITVTLGGATLAEGTDYTYNEATGLFATVPGRITLPAATFTQDPVTGVYQVTPSETVLSVTGTI